MDPSIYSIGMMGRFEPQRSPSIVIVLESNDIYGRKKSTALCPWVI
jgi:hypothetical protein